MRYTHSEPDDGRDVAAWMQELAAIPVDGPRLPDSQVLWWKAQALRRWDTQRQATAPLDTGEDIQIVRGVVATIALLGWVARAVPEIWTVPSFALVTVVSSAVVAAAAALTVWDMRRTSQG